MCHLDLEESITHLWKYFFHLKFGQHCHTFFFSQLSTAIFVTKLSAKQLEARVWAYGRGRGDGNAVAF